MRRVRLAVHLVGSALAGALFATMCAILIGPAHPWSAFITALLLFPVFTYAFYWAQFVRRKELQRKFRREEALQEASERPTKEA